MLNRDEFKVIGEQEADTNILNEFDARQNLTTSDSSDVDNILEVDIDKDDDDYETEEADHDQRVVLLDEEADDDVSVVPVNRVGVVEEYSGADDGDFQPNNDYDDDDLYDMFFEQFLDNNDSNVGNPPASKAVVDELPTVFITKEDFENKVNTCAVCEDEFEMGKRVTQLPCTHRFHLHCIVRWLEIRNTCPVCRFELLTDDSNYERRKAERDDALV